MKIEFCLNGVTVFLKRNGKEAAYRNAIFRPVGVITSVTISDFMDKQWHHHRAPWETVSLKNLVRCCHNTFFLLSSFRKFIKYITFNFFLMQTPTGNERVSVISDRFLENLAVENIASNPEIICCLLPSENRLLPDFPSFPPPPFWECPLACPWVLSRILSLNKGIRAISALRLYYTWAEPFLWHILSAFLSGISCCFIYLAILDTTRYLTSNAYFLKSCPCFKLRSLILNWPV